jgi:hypothetical protein
MLRPNSRSCRTASISLRHSRRLSGRVRSLSYRRAAHRMLERGRQAACLGAFEGHLDVVEVLAGCDQGVGFDGAVALNQPLPERSQRRAAAMSAARLGVDHGVAKAIVHVVDQEPSPPVRHSELAAGLGDRSGLVDRLEQADLSGAQRASAAQVHSQRQFCRIHVAVPQQLPVSRSDDRNPRRQRNRPTIEAADVT